MSARASAAGAPDADVVLARYAHRGRRATQARLMRTTRPTARAVALQAIPLGAVRQFR
jgi:hypothetical protein